MIRFVVSVSFFLIMTAVCRQEALSEEKTLDPKNHCPMCHLSQSLKGSPEATAFSSPKIQELLSTPECLQCHHSQDVVIRDAVVSSPLFESEGVSLTRPESLGTPSPGSPSKRAEDKKDMVFIPAGPALIGTNVRLPDEGPQHRVTVGPYEIDLYEVTNEQYQKFTRATDRQTPDHWRSGVYPKGKARHPVTFVTWYDADAYCRWAGKRLPTNDEWEKAARGPAGRIFPWGDQFDKQKANVPLLGIGDTTPVGQFKDGKSYYGLYDMSGNVWEWTSSWYTAYPGNQHPTENYGEKYKVLKGGSWFDCSFYKCGISAPSFNRSFFIAETKNPSFGFRCAKDP
jgi:formylglycine-generating enzyme required for sulfatase activity